MKSIIKGKRKSFSLLEILLVVGIAIILLGILIPVLKRGKDKTKELACINNLRNLSLAIQTYKNECGVYPHGDLSSGLRKYLPEGQDIYACPSNGEFYDNYYVAREGDDEDLYIIGCPLHAVVNYTPGKGTRTFQTGRILHNGEVVTAGSEVTDGELEFEDGSTASLTGTATIVTSFRTMAGKLYTILRVLEAYGDTNITVEVPENQGSKFEVVTPAAIAGVAGTKFHIKTATDAQGNRVTTLNVFRGKVKLKGRKGTPDGVTTIVGEEDGDVQKSGPAKQCQDDPLPATRIHGHGAP